MSALSYADAMNAWIQAGGNPQAAQMAAAIAVASSGLNPDASATASDGSGIISRGLWQIPSTFNALSTNDPVANARAAIQVSSNGTDWHSWKAAWSDNAGGSNGGQYLGSGANAVAALQQNGGSYNLVGGSPVSITPQSDSVDQEQADPSGAQTTTATAPTASKGSASTSTISSEGSGSKGGSRTFILLLFFVVALVIYVYMRSKSGHKPGPTPPPPTP